MSNKLSIDEAYNLWLEWGGTGYSSSRALRQAMREKRYGTQGKYYWEVTIAHLREYLNYVKSRGNVKMTTTAATASTRFNAPISANSRNFYRPEAGELEEPLVKPELARLAGDVPEWNPVKQMRYGSRHDNLAGH